MTAPLADCCPDCFPGDHDAVAPLLVLPDGNGSLWARYRHEACGREWDCWWDAEASDWPLKAEDLNMPQADAERAA